MRARIVAACVSGRVCDELANGREPMRDAEEVEDQGRLLGAQCEREVLLRVSVGKCVMSQ